MLDDKAIAVRINLFPQVRCNRAMCEAHPAYELTSSALVADSQMSSYKIASIPKDQHQQNGEPGARTLDEVCAYADAFRLCIWQCEGGEVALVRVAASECVYGADESFPVCSGEVGSVICCSLVFTLAEGKALAEPLECVMVHGHHK